MKGLPVLFYNDGALETSTRTSPLRDCHYSCPLNHLLDRAYSELVVPNPLDLSGRPKLDCGRRVTRGASAEIVHVPDINVNRLDVSPGPVQWPFSRT